MPQAPKTLMTPEQVKEDLANKNKNVENPKTKERTTGRAKCICNWKSVTKDSKPHEALKAWTAHMYAQGYRTKDAIDLAVATKKHDFIYDR